MSNEKGGSDVMDDCCNTHNSMATGAGERLYDGFVYSHPAGHCHHRRSGQIHSGAETVVAISLHTDHLPQKLQRLVTAQ